MKNANNKEGTMQKILPITYPFITSYPTVANFLAIFSSHEERLLWFYNYLFQLSLHTTDLRIDFDISRYPITFMENCPLVYTHGLSRSFIEDNFESFIDFIKKAVNDEYYLYFMVDKYDIPAYVEMYQKYHANHDLMLFGYDMEKQIVHIADFFGGKYDFKKASLTQIETAYNNCSTDYINGVVLIKKSNCYPTKFNIRTLKNLIYDYLKSENNVKLTNREIMLRDEYYIYGLSIYDELIKQIQENHSNPYAMDIRNYHVLYDHKILILKLIFELHKKGYLEEYEYFSNGFLKLKDQLLMLRNLLLKYRISNSINPEKIVQILKQAQEEETKLLEKLLLSIVEEPHFHDQMQHADKNYAVFEGIDNATKGNWNNQYGTIGFDIIGGRCHLDKSITLRYNDAQFFVYEESSDDERALFIGDTENERIAAVRYHDNCFALDLFVDKKEEIKVSLYMLDYDYLGRVVNLEFLDGDNEELLFCNTISNFAEGVFLSLKVKGHIQIRFKNTGSGNVVLSGIFFDKLLEH